MTEKVFWKGLLLIANLLLCILYRLSCEMPGPRKNREAESIVEEIRQLSEESNLSQRIIRKNV